MTALCRPALDNISVHDIPASLPIIDETSSIVDDTASIIANFLPVIPVKTGIQSPVLA